VSSLPDPVLHDSPRAPVCDSGYPGLLRGEQYSCSYETAEAGCLWLELPPGAPGTGRRGLAFNVEPEARDMSEAEFREAIRQSIQRLEATAAQEEDPEALESHQGCLVALRWAVERPIRLRFRPVPQWGRGPAEDGQHDPVLHDRIVPEDEILLYPTLIGGRDMSEVREEGGLLLALPPGTIDPRYAAHVVLPSEARSMEIEELRTPLLRTAEAIDAEADADAKAGAVPEDVEILRRAARGLRWAAGRNIRVQLSQPLPWEAGES
jgi:hypothetical protein